MVNVKEAMTDNIQVIDIETTGLDPVEHDVVELGWCSVDYGDDARWRVGSGGAEFVFPGREIPPEASAVHHIIDADVLRAERLVMVAKRLDGDILAAHDAKFEQGFLNEFTFARWICTYKCALRVWPDAPSHSNQTLRYWLNPEGLGRAIPQPAHRAYPDAYVTAFLLRDILNEHLTVEEAIQVSNEPALLKKVHFGKHQGQQWSEVPLGYLHWAFDQDFDEDVAYTVRHEIQRRSVNG